jgi:protein SCO1/2
MKTLASCLVLIGLMAAAALAIGMAKQRKSAEYQTIGSIQTAREEKHFHVRGEVRGVDVQAKTIRIRHEEIPDYMPAMIMPFSVRDASLLKGLSAGDEIGFVLAVTKEDSWITQIQRLSESGPTAESRSDIQPGDPLQPGETLPDFTLTDQNGHPVHLKDFRGKIVLLTFIYTRCPLPNFCPLMSRNFASLQQRLQKELPGKFHLLSVTIDPEFDRPEVLKDYAARQSADERTWSFATGSADDIGAVTSLFGLIHERAGGLINHDLRTALIGSDGKLVHTWKSNLWTPYEVQRRVEEVLTPATRASAR